MKQASRNLALCGVLCALAVAIMAMGTILPVATYCAPVLASMTLLPVLILCGEKLSWAMFFASAMLSLLLAPDKEAAAIFLALGYYPIVKPKLDRKPARCAARGIFRDVGRAACRLAARRQLPVLAGRPAARALCAEGGCALRALGEKTQISKAAERLV